MKLQKFKSQNEYMITQEEYPRVITSCSFLTLAFASSLPPVSN